MKEITSIKKLINIIRDQISSFNLFSNTIYLLFLKYLMEYPERVGEKDLIDYKAIFDFKKLFDQARSGKRFLLSSDYELLFNGFDDKRAAEAAFFFHDLCSTYGQMFSKEDSQCIIFNCLSEFELPGTNDEMRDLFEIVLDACGGDVTRTGIHTTSRSLRKIVSKILDVQSNEIFMDCYCGYSTMLLSIDDYSQYLGFDIDYNSAIVSTMIELMLGKNRSYIECRDFFEVDYKVSKIFADAPLSMMANPHVMIGSPYFEKTKDVNIASLYKGIDSLREGGVGVFTVPSKALYSNTKGYVDFRKFIATSGLRAIVELPAMWPGTSIQTNLLVIEKGYTGNVEFISANEFGTKTRNGIVLSDEEIRSIIKAYRENLNTLAFCASIERAKVMDAEYLSAYWFVPTQKDDVQYRDVEEIDNELSALYEQFNKNLK